MKNWGQTLFIVILAVSFGLATWSAYCTREKREAEQLLEKQNETDKNLSHTERFLKSTRKAFHPSH